MKTSQVIIFRAGDDSLGIFTLSSEQRSHNRNSTSQTWPATYVPRGMLDYITRTTRERREKMFTCYKKGLRDAHRGSHLSERESRERVNPN